MMVQTLGGGYKIDDRELVIRPPLDLHLPLGAQKADPMALEAVYKTVLSSAATPGANITGDRIRVAIAWLVKACCFAMPSRRIRNAARAARAF